MTTKVLVVDDSTLFQRKLSRIVDAADDLECIGIATNGIEACDMVNKLSPDVVTMDVNMPILDGISAVKHIMKDKPTPIIMLSSLTTEGATMTFDAMEAGAVDFLPKEAKYVDGKDGEEGLVEKIRCVAKRKLHTNVPVIQKSQTAKSTSFKNNSGIDLIIIGSSTGGPIATSNIIVNLPVNIPSPIVLVQHMPENFTSQYAQRLNSHSELKVVEAENGMQLQAGTVYVAPGGLQLGFQGSKSNPSIKISEELLTKSVYKPSVNNSFLEAAKLFPGSTLAIVLTGMGDDGAIGALELANLGSKVWAQDKDSSVVFGMPQAVIKNNAASKVLGITEFCDYIMREYN